jgi:hypothetical protein
VGEWHDEVHIKLFVDLSALANGAGIHDVSGEFSGILFFEGFLDDVAFLAVVVNGGLDVAHGVAFERAIEVLGDGGCGAHGLFVECWKNVLNRIFVVVQGFDDSSHFF